LLADSALFLAPEPVRIGRFRVPLISAIIEVKSQIPRLWSQWDSILQSLPLPALPARETFAADMQRRLSRESSQRLFAYSTPDDRPAQRMDMMYQQLAGHMQNLCPQVALDLWAVRRGPKFLDHP